MERILLLENGALPDESIAPQLVAEGYRVQRLDADAGAGGYPINGPPDVVIVNTPSTQETVGSVIEALGRDPATAMVPVMHVYAGDCSEQMYAVMNTGVDDCISSPIVWDHLQTVLRARLRLSRHVLKRYRDHLTLARSKLAEAISHEVFAPLFEIEARSEYLAREGAALSPDESRSIAKDVLESSQALHRMLGKVKLANALSYNGDLEVRSVFEGLALPVSPVITRTAEMISNRHGREDDLVILINSATVSIPVVDLARIVEELVDTAMLISPTGIPVYVSGRVEDEFVLSVRCRLPRTDNGLAVMASDKADRWMDDLEDQFSLTGLHISREIVNQLVALHRGTLEMTNTDADEFHALVSLPLVAVGNPHSAPVTASAGAYH